jgi:hypothetical protein
MGHIKNNDNNTMPMFIVLQKTKQNMDAARGMAQEKINKDVLKQMYFNE